MAAPRTGKQQHPGGLLLDGGPTNVVVIPPSLYFCFCFALRFQWRRKRAKRDVTDSSGKPSRGDAVRLIPHSLRSVIRGRDKDSGASGGGGGGGRRGGQVFDMVPSGFPRKIQHDSFRLSKLESKSA